MPGKHSRRWRAMSNHTEGTYTLQTAPGRTVWIENGTWTSTVGTPGRTPSKSKAKKCIILQVPFRVCRRNIVDHVGEYHIYTYRKSQELQSIELRVMEGQPIFSPGFDGLEGIILSNFLITICCWTQTSEFRCVYRMKPLCNRIFNFRIISNIEIEKCLV